MTWNSWRKRIAPQRLPHSPGRPAPETGGNVLIGRHTPPGNARYDIIYTLLKKRHTHPLTITTEAPQKTTCLRLTPWK
jgi:hypothetical protein